MKRIILLSFWLLSLLGLHAQELTVKSMEVAPMDLSASTQPRNDLNGNPCALVKVQLATAGASFEGNVIGDVAYSQGEYWVYMSAGSYMLNIKHSSFVPLFVSFRDYDIKRVEGKTTYVLTLLMPQMSTGPVDDGLRYIAMSVEPASAMVYIDEQPQPLQNGKLNLLLPMGSHSYRVEATGYEMKTGSFTLGDEKLSLPVRLASTMATLKVTCPTTGAKIYVNDQLRGTGSWSGQLAAGAYRVEARYDGHRPQRQTITLAKRANEKVTIPALQPIVGNLNVNYQPQDAEVWIDGKKLGTSPDIFRNIIIGTHEVELRKEGYASEKKQVTISEGQTVSLTGSLQMSSTLTGPAVETFTVNGVSFKMIRVEGGTFQMGCNDYDAISNEKPVHQVTLSSFSIGETEVTQALWYAVMGLRPTSDGDKWLSIFGLGDAYPAYYISWNDCQTFIRKLNQITGKTFRLPTEAEWEYAARGGKKSRGYKYSGSNRINDVAIYGDNSNNKGKNNPDYGTHRVKSKQANELGIYDMSGNVDEWCFDGWDGNSGYSSTNQVNPQGNNNYSVRVARGGSWTYSDVGCRVYYRDRSPSGKRYMFMGFRLALTLERNN